MPCGKRGRETEKNRAAELRPPVGAGAIDRMAKEKILIVDDSEMNRAILADMLDDQYEILEAEDGLQAVAALQKQGANISLVLLDIVMPRMDGFGVLEIMNQNGWIDEIPVITVSAESSSTQVQRAYELGVTDFIMRPFDVFIVRRRVVNTLLLYAKQKQLIGMVEQQIYEKEQRSNQMIDILSHIVEFRNGESGLHILHVRRLTEFLLRKIRQRTDRYPLTDADISTISVVSALHDIGKIAIDEAILNKPGRLTDEEFAVMKTHSLVGAEMLQSIPRWGDGEKVLKTAYEICRWHHERWDGRGYPDGLKGDDIPISAQIVALADVYDALTSKRVYKPAFSHEKAIEMITGGECGAFNPLLLECLSTYSEELRDVLARDESESSTATRDVRSAADALMQTSGAGVSQRTLRLLDYERMKHNFFAAMTEEIQFEFTVSPPMLTLSPWGAKKLRLEEIIMSPKENDALQQVLGPGGWDDVGRALRATTPEHPEYTCERQVRCAGELRWHRIIARSVWSQDDPPVFQGALGKAIDIEADKAEREDLVRRATRDPLTGLLNRVSFIERISHRMWEYPESHFALAEVDIDDFKEVNDTNGHMFGDEVLHELAMHMKNSVRSSDICCRAGGEEFFFFLQYNTDIERTIDRIFHSLCFQYKDWPITVSVGVALGEDVGLSYEALYRAADQALYVAKGSGKNQYRFYDPSMEGVATDTNGQGERSAP